MGFDLKNIKELENLIMPHIALTFFKYRARASALLKKINADMTIDQLIILNLLSIKGATSQQEVAEFLFKDKSNLSRMVNTLEEKGLIERKLDLKEHRTVKILHLTPKGLNVVTKLRAFAFALHDHTTNNLSQEEFMTLKSIMQKIRDNLDTSFEFEGMIL